MGGDIHLLPYMSLWHKQEQLNVKDKITLVLVV
jgi:hypothetical protein